MQTTTVRAAHGASIEVLANDEVRVINTSGTQVVDFWCLLESGADEYLSMEHCREVLGKIYFSRGDILISNRYTPLIEYIEDTTGGHHDTLIAACSSEMYKKFGLAEHPSCASNFLKAIKSHSRVMPFVPSPWNLFMRAEVKEDGIIAYSRPPYIPAGCVGLRMLRDAIIVVSACPDNCYPTNGGDGSPRDFAITVSRG